MSSHAATQIEHHRSHSAEDLRAIQRDLCAGTRSKTGRDGKDIDDWCESVDIIR